MNTTINNELKSGISERIATVPHGLFMHSIYVHMLMIKTIFMWEWWVRLNLANHWHIEKKKKKWLFLYMRFHCVHCALCTQNEWDEAKQKKTSFYN